MYLDIRNLLTWLDKQTQTFMKSSLDVAPADLSVLMRTMLVSVSNCNSQGIDYG